ncbi:MAG: hypothetical protein ACJAXB_002733 [Candidatus Endobugula sp.]|jgi:hypothetical protein
MPIDRQGREAPHKFSIIVWEILAFAGMTVLFYSPHWKTTSG